MSKIYVEAVAVWNDKKGVWEVEVYQKDEYISITNHFCTSERTRKCEIETCDELVIPTALLEMNGLKLD
jgi:hypothetical protein